MGAPSAGYSLETSSSSSATGQSRSGFDNSGFVVNFGGTGGVTTGQVVSPYVWLAVAAGVAWVLLRKS